MRITISSLRKRLPRTMLFQLFAGAICLMSLYAFAELAYRAYYEIAAKPFTADTPIYWAVGRGITNGFTPYVDLFEKKPPGIFLLSALSFSLTKSTLLTHVAQAIAIIGMPVFTLALYWKDLRVFKKTNRLLAINLLLLFSILLAYFSAKKSGFVQIESFGAFFGILYIAWIAREEYAKKKWEILCAGVLLLCSSGMKEPFVLANIGGALLLSFQRKNVRNTIVYPLLIAIALGTTALFVLGYATGYFGMYLPEMLGNHFQRSSSIWERGTRYYKFLTSAYKYSPIFPLVVYVIALQSFLLECVQPKNLLRKCCMTFCICGVASYLTLVAVGMGSQFFNHHFVFGVPLLFTFLLLLIRNSQKIRSMQLLGVNFSILCILIFLCFTTVYKPAYAKKIPKKLRTYSNIEAKAKAVDSLLDACEIERYQFLGGNGKKFYGLTEHSPLGPFFFQFNIWFNSQHTKFQQLFLEQLSKADLVIYRKNKLGEIHDQVEGILHTEFRTKPWKCAREYVNTPELQKFTFYFRK